MKVAILRDAENLTTNEYLNILIKYLSVLQDGRAKPDMKPSGGYVRESSYNILEIEEVKRQINDILRIQKKEDTIEFENKIYNKNKKYF